MPFWEAIKRCQHCRFWRHADPSVPVGICDQQAVVAKPFWLTHSAHELTRWDAGVDCKVYEHDAHKSHPLGRAGAYLANVQVGDRITLRTYGIGDISRVEAEVVGYGNGFAVVRAFNGSYRMRLKDAVRGRGGTLVGMEDWGVDVDKAPIKGDVEPFDLAKAQAMLANIKPGDMLPLLYLIDGTTKRRVRVLKVSKDYVSIRIDKRTARMVRSGNSAGIIGTELWTIDTGAGHACEENPAT